MCFSNLHGERTELPLGRVVLRLSQRLRRERRPGNLHTLDARAAWCWLSAVTLVVASCADDGAVSGTPSLTVSTSTSSAVATTATTVAATTVTTQAMVATAPSSAFPDDSIPVDDLAADRGCLDEPGRLSAGASSWYPGRTGSPLGLNGDLGTSVEADRFAAAATAEIQRVAPEFVLNDAYEYRRSSGGCVTHRYAILTNDNEEQVVVSAWRLESAGDPFWVPNETGFVALDRSTLVSSGAHIAVVLAVAADGTTVRVTAYGARATSMVAGWPTTTTSSPSAAKPGIASIAVEQLLPPARTTLSHLLGQR